MLNLRSDMMCNNSLRIPGKELFHLCSILSFGMKSAAFLRSLGRNITIAAIEKYFVPAEPKSPDSSIAMRPVTVHPYR